MFLFHFDQIIRFTSYSIDFECIKKGEPHTAMYPQIEWKVAPNSEKCVCVEKKSNPCEKAFSKCKSSIQWVLSKTFTFTISVSSMRTSDDSSKSNTQYSSPL